jgi:hypothetical protein
MADVHELAGGCQCGAVRFTARLESLDAYFCHCRMCQRAFGNVFATYVNLPKADVSWNGAPSYFASSKIARRGFCAKCGTPLTFEYHESARMDLAAGAFDDPTRFKPVMQVGVESRIASFMHADGLPEKRIADFEHIGKKWKAAYGENVVPGEEAAKRER